MNREIKFRAWDSDNGCMEFFYLEDLSSGLVGSNDNHIGNMTVMQYTGLKDKNGKEIYEGDIVEVKTSDKDDAWSYGYHPVEHWKSGFYIKFGRRNLLHCWLAWSHVVVIGNIYENPELIDSK